MFMANLSLLFVDWLKISKRSVGFQFFDLQQTANHHLRCRVWLGDMKDQMARTTEACNIYSFNASMQTLSRI